MQKLHQYIYMCGVENGNLVWFIEQIIFLLVSIGIVFITGLVNKRIKQHQMLMNLVSGIIIAGITSYLFLTTPFQGTYFMYTFASTIIILMTIRILNLVEFNRLEYAVLYLLLFQYKNIQIFFPVRESFTLLIYSIIIFGLVATKKNEFWGNVFNIWVTAIVCVIVYGLFEVIYEEVLYKIYFYMRAFLAIGTITKALYFVMIMIVAIAINGWLMKKLKRVLEPISIKLKELGKSYTKVEKQFLGFAIISILVLYGMQQLVCMLEFFKDIKAWEYIMVTGLSWIVVLLVMAIQGYIIYMMVELAYTRKILEDERFQNQSLLLYQNDLDKNIGQMIKINHDIKNIFFTVGSFVERSGDEEMKQYFNEKIMPFALDEMKRSSLYQKLQVIVDEQLRAFLYYKIQQGWACQINVELELELKGKVEYPIAFIDLIRILGILIDNAIEECTHIPRGRIHIKIVEDKSGQSFRIANDIRASQKQRTNFVGTSTKGLGRGNGLVIVKELISKYENVVLNTYMKEENFIQQLVIYSK